MVDQLVFVLAIVGLTFGGAVVSESDVGARLYPVDCVVPSCATELDRATIWPFEDPNFFLRCEPTGAPWELVRHPCTGRRLFDFERQMCTVPQMWEEPCAVLGNPAPELGPCPEARCDNVGDLRRLWPTEEPARFLQCIPQAGGGVAPVPQYCPFATQFSLRLQACVTVHRWERECLFDGENTPDPTGGDTDPTTTELPLPPTSTLPGWTLCQPPVCEPEDPVLYPHTDPASFWQCVPQPTGFWVAQQRPCGAGTLFHYALQQCVFPADWENFCPA
uniref:Chitin-binding type-2 domain-containing protein n=1 Tax=Anopheles farauti TaxID=69004 RepID=A0A182QTM9_9DIPT